MSSKIYFNDNSNNLLRHFVRFASEAYRVIYPTGAQRQLRQLLTTPQKRKPSDIPEDFHSEAHTTPYGDLMAYSTGEGPTVLFVHGWSGSASQFFNLMRSIAALGYKAVAYDHYKHGHSNGKECNYPLFIKSLAYLENKLYTLDSLHCVVSHSMGASATLDFFKDYDKPHFLIAPLFNFYDELSNRVMGIGISRSFFEKIVSEIESDYDITVKDHDSTEHIDLIKSPINIIHSENDKFALHHFSQHLAEQHEHIQLQSIDAAENIGHMRIVNIVETESALKQFLKALP